MYNTIFNTLINKSTTDEQILSCLNVLVTSNKDAHILTNLVGIYFHIPVALQPYKEQQEEDEQLNLYSTENEKAYKKLISISDIEYPFSNKLYITIQDKFIILRFQNKSYTYQAESLPEGIRPLGGWPKWTGLYGAVEKKDGYILLNSEYPYKEVIEYLDTFNKVWDILNKANYLQQYYTAAEYKEKLAILVYAILTCLGQ